MISAKGQNGTVHFDGRFVTIERSGFFARAINGKGEKRIPVASITAVQWKPAGAMVNGFIEFTIEGSSETRSRAGSATFDAGKSENAVVVTKKQSPDFETLRKAVEDAIVGGPVAAAPAAPPVPPPPAIPAGWHPDPNGAKLQRYWDGSQWTEHTAPLA